MSGVGTNDGRTVKRVQGTVVRGLKDIKNGKEINKTKGAT